jgi:ribosomal protein S18 acetylase RimI-like enzyme
MTAPTAPDALEGEIVIRRATEADAARVAEFAQRTFVENFGAYNTAENLAAHVAKSFGPEIQLREIRDLQSVTLLAELGATVASFAQVRRGRRPSCVTGTAPVELQRFYVDRPFHGRGVAQQLMRAVEDVARELGGRTLWLGVWEHNLRAIAFYSKCGFVDIGQHSFFVGTDEQTDRVMSRPLL